MATLSRFQQRTSERQDAEVQLSPYAKDEIRNLGHPNLQDGMKLLEKAFDEVMAFKSSSADSEQFLKEQVIRWRSTAEKSEDRLYHLHKGLNAELNSYKQSFADLESLRQANGDLQSKVADLSLKVQDRTSKIEQLETGLEAAAANVERAERRAGNAESISRETEARFAELHNLLDSHCQRLMTAGSSRSVQEPTEIAA